MRFRKKITVYTRPQKSWYTWSPQKELFGFLADKTATVTRETSIVLTKEDNIVSNRAKNTDFV